MRQPQLFDLAVIGGGSGGVGAALAAARAGLSVLLVEARDQLGGTSTLGGVTCWEMGAGGTGIPFDLYQRLRRIPQAAGIYSPGRHFCWQDDGWHWPHRLDKVVFPGGENVIDPARRYRDTLRRHPEPGVPLSRDWCREHWHGVVFEPEAMARVMHEALAETGRCELRTGVPFSAATGADGRVRHADLSDGTRVQAAFWVDATGDGDLCAALGCRFFLGLDPRARFHEPGAPAEAADRVNGVTLMYRVALCDAPALEPLPADVPERCWWAPAFPPMCCNHYPNGDRSCNMLPAMEGAEFLRLGREAATAECRRRLRAHWHFVQTHWPEFQRFRLAWVAPLLGVRESRRIEAEFMLTEKDIRLGLSGQELPDIVAVADHALDRHGEQGGCPEVAEPYGIPYRCLIPRGWQNLLVACRAAGFSSIAASSVRLSRTLMQLGQAAGTAAALARELGLDLPRVPCAELRTRLRAQRVQLEWPLPPALQAHLADE